MTFPLGSAIIEFFTTNKRLKIEGWLSNTSRGEAASLPQRMDDRQKITVDVHACFIKSWHNKPLSWLTSEKTTF